MEKITLEHPDSQSYDLIAQQIEQLSQLFPEVIKEGRVDFEALQDLLGNYIDTPEERFQLNWAGKAQARREAQKRSTGTLRPCPEESVNWSTTENLYIEGDNLEVLKLLQKSYYKKVKMIYIDPPYNTGNDFVYKDNYSDNLTNYLEISGQDRTLGTNTESDGRYHSNWLNMIYPRLKLARNLLTYDGVILISIDDNEVHNLRKVCDEIFGEVNFVANIVWQKKYAATNDSKGFSTTHDHIIVYQKSDLFNRNLLSRTEEQNAPYKNDDKDGRGLWRADNILVKSFSTSGVYPIVNPNTGVEFLPPEGSCWRASQETMTKWLAENRIYFGKDGKGAPQLKRYLNEVQQGKVPITWWTFQEVGHNDAANKEVTALFGAKTPFDTPKPTTLIRQILLIASQSDSIILDFFSGSATTAHAVMQLNSEDGGNRKFIMVQLPEATPEDSEARKAGYKTIAEIGKERIRRAGKKILEDLKAKQAKEGALFSEELKKLDIGFKVFKLDSSNINTWDTSPSNLEGALYNSVQNIKSDRTEHDLLYEILLKYGIDLVQPINEHVLAGKKVYEMGAGALIVCMADHVKPEVAEAIAQLWKEVKPTAIDESSKVAINCRVVFKDNGFDDNNDKTNIFQILKQHGIDNVVTI
ncbi:MAG: site-specific DNA-methyltransferase [Bacteroidales bacterium]